MQVRKQAVYVVTESWAPNEDSDGVGDADYPINCMEVFRQPEDALACGEDLVKDLVSGHSDEFNPPPEVERRTPKRDLLMQVMVVTTFSVYWVDVSRQYVSDEFPIRRSSLPSRGAVPNLPDGVTVGDPIVGVVGEPERAGGGDINGYGTSQ